MAVVAPVEKGRTIYIAAGDAGAAWTKVKRVTAIHPFAVADTCTVELKVGGASGNLIYDYASTDALGANDTKLPLTPLQFAEPQDLDSLYVAALAGAYLVIFIA